LEWRRFVLALRHQHGSETFRETEQKFSAAMRGTQRVRRISSLDFAPIAAHNLPRGDGRS
jgi:hypothetical protein